jgi:hypothetical protein
VVPADFDMQVRLYYSIATNQTAAKWPMPILCWYGAQYACSLLLAVLGPTPLTAAGCCCCLHAQVFLSLIPVVADTPGAIALCSCLVMKSC